MHSDVRGMLALYFYLTIYKSYIYMFLLIIWFNFNVRLYVKSRSD